MTVERMGPIRRLAGETWRDAVARVGEYIGKAWEALKIYDGYLCLNKTPREAAAMVVHDYNLELALV